MSLTAALPTDITAVDGATESEPAVESVPDIEVSAAALPKEPRAGVRSKKQTPPSDQAPTIQGD